MNVKVIADLSGIAGIDSVQVIQRNKVVGIYYPFCEYKENTILVNVPSYIPSPDYKENNNIWEKFVDIFVEVIKKALHFNHKSIIISELGEGLLWTNILIAKAAREALVKVCPFIPDDFMVIFHVNKDEYEMWDKVMQF